MTRFTTRFGWLLVVTSLAMCLSCSKPGTPVQENVLVGKWQRIDKPAVTLTFVTNGTFSAQVAGQRVMGGEFRLIDGGHLVLAFDASSPKAGIVTNKVSLASGELKIVPVDAESERYKRVE